MPPSRNAASCDAFDSASELVVVQLQKRICLTAEALSHRCGEFLGIAEGDAEEGKASSRFEPTSTSTSLLLPSAMSVDVSSVRYQPSTIGRPPGNPF